MVVLREALAADTQLNLRWVSDNPVSLLGLPVRSSEQALWLCPVCVQVSSASIRSKVNNPVSCAVCQGLTVVAGVNDLASQRPEVASEWGVNNLGPDQVSVSSGFTASWVCATCSFGWNAKVAERTRSVKNTGCPSCAKKRTLYGLLGDKVLPDGAAVPLLMKQWFVSVVSEQIPAVSMSSRKACNWRCGVGHEWVASAFSILKSTVCPECALGSNSLNVTHPDLALQWSLDNVKAVSDVTAGSAYKAGWVCSYGHKWEAFVYSRSRGSGCPVCVSAVSSDEMLVRNFCSSLGLDVVFNTRQVLKGLEIDIFFPEKMVGVEFNGLYWHSEAGGRDRLYHHDKWLAAKKAGIQLIQVWEDDWKRSPKLVESMLAHKLGLSTQPKVFARSCVAGYVSSSEAETFLNSNHVQGFVHGLKYAGLKDKQGVLQALFVVKWEAGSDKSRLSILRYATASQVVGGFTKLLRFVEKDLTPSAFVTFADHMVSDGRLYESNGFVADKEIPPDYMYVVNKVRKHKFGYRLKRFRDDAALKHVDGLSERELALLNNLPRVWDAGKTRYVLNFDISKNLR